MSQLSRNLNDVFLQGASFQMSGQEKTPLVKKLTIRKKPGNGDSHYTLRKRDAARNEAQESATESITDSTESSIPNLTITTTFEYPPDSKIGENLTYSLLEKESGFEKKMENLSSNGSSLVGKTVSKDVTTTHRNEMDAFEPADHKPKNIREMLEKYVLSLLILSLLSGHGWVYN